MASIFQKSLLAASVALGLGAPMAANAAGNTDMYVVVFRADWCGPCKVMEPKLHSALNSLRDPGMEYVEFDFTNTQTQIPANKAFDRQIVPQYNKWFPMTGFAVMIDADSKRTLGCINQTYDIESMKAHLRNLKSQAVTNRYTQDMTCPPRNN